MTGQKRNRDCIRDRNDEAALKKLVCSFHSVRPLPFGEHRDCTGVRDFAGLLAQHARVGTDHSALLPLRSPFAVCPRPFFLPVPYSHLCSGAASLSTVMSGPVVPFLFLAYSFFVFYYPSSSISFRHLLGRGVVVGGDVRRGSAPRRGGRGGSGK
jgi:hypothetical protein